jgi:uncharacterized protein (TIGR02466 family)
MTIDGLFPVPVGNLHMDKAVSKKIVDLIKSVDMNLIRNNGGNSISSDVYILDNEEFSDIKQVLTDSVNQYFKEIINPGEDVKLYITNSWINMNKNGESHHLHTHRNSIVSAVLYIDTCEGDTISFLNPNDNLFGNFIFSSFPRHFFDSVNASADTDTLIIFPSTLQHMVSPRPNTCTGTRISLSFNTWFKGIIGEGDGSPTQLHL